MTDAPENDFLNELGSDYQYGFHDPETSSFRSQKGLSEEVIRQIAGYLKKVVTRENPLLEGILPLDDSRFAGQLYPVVSHPAIAIRRRAIRVFTLEDYIASGVMTEAQCASIRRAVGERQNIVIVGGTSSGKTTLGNTQDHTQLTRPPVTGGGSQALAEF